MTRITSLADLPLSDDVRRLNPEAIEPGQRPTKASKYGNVRCQIDGISFDSLAEGNRYSELRLLEKAGIIRLLCPSPALPKKERFKLTAGLAYTPDFTYYEDGRRVAEDVKGGKATMTQAARMRVKLFRECYPDIELRITER